MVHKLTLHLLIAQGQAGVHVNKYITQTQKNHFDHIIKQIKEPCNKDCVIHHSFNLHCPFCKIELIPLLTNTLATIQPKV